MRFYTSLYILSLLLLLPQAMLGQTYSNQHEVPKYESKGWWNLFVHGGTIRTKDETGHRVGVYYMNLESGLDLIRFDYVNGFAYGPKLTLGKMMDNLGRWETDVDVEWASSRDVLMWDLAIRYILPPEWQSRVEVFLSSHTEDFDPDPLMNQAQKQVATALFGWNGYKMYDAERFGFKGATLLHDDVMMAGAVWYENRKEERNHRKRNVFRQIGSGNGIVHFDDCDLWRSDLSVVVKPGSRLYVYDDMHTTWKSKAPTLRLNSHWGWKEKLRYVSVDLDIRHHIGDLTDKHQFDYYGSLGFFPVRDDVMLADMHHFDASHFLWQNRMESSLTWFSLLTNYERSTSKRWAELHGEYLYRHNRVFAQYVQLHYLSVADCRMHMELSYGWNLSKELRIGLSAGWDGGHYDGLGFNLIICSQ